MSNILLKPHLLNFTHIILLQMPQSSDDWKRIAKTFQDRWDFPNTIGAMDGKHIKIRQPPHSGSTFFNYKGTFSIVLLALVDADYKFIYCDVGCNGRVSDGGVYGGCTLQESLANRTAQLPETTALPGTDTKCSYHIVADDAFLLKDEIMKPYRTRELTKEKRIFNYRLSRARRISENAFGIITARYRVLHTIMQLTPEKAEIVVLAICALHNYLMSRGDRVYAPEVMMDQEDPVTHEIIPGQWRQVDPLLQAGLPHRNRPTLSAKEKRIMLTNYVNNEGAVEWQEQMI
jgi:hypothetical protein